MDIVQYRYEQELQSYPSMPLAVFLNGHEWPDSVYEFSIAACARWESQYIIEWVQYHLSIGFEHIYLYCNDDDPTELYEVLLPFIEDLKVTFCYYNHIGLQRQMYFHFLRNYSHQTKWFIFLDIDEFICIRSIDNIQKFVQTFPEDTEAVYFNWCLYGCNEYDTPASGSVLYNYIKRDPSANPHTKVLIQSKRVPYKKIFYNDHIPFWHWYIPLDPTIISYSAFRIKIPVNYCEDFPNNAYAYLQNNNMLEAFVNIGYIAHFQFKSKQSFEMKTQRSSIGEFQNTVFFSKMTPEEKTHYHFATNFTQDKYLHNYFNKNYKQFQLKSHTKHKKALPFYILPNCQWPLISRYKPAIQSSAINDDNIIGNAQKIVNGILTGKAQHHTKLEVKPWWIINLQERYLIQEIRLYNRLDTQLSNVDQFEISVSTNQKDWKVCFIKTDNFLYGGADGTAFIIKFSEIIETQWIKVTLLKYTAMTFDQIEIYGNN